MNESWQTLRTEPFDGINFYRDEKGDVAISSFLFKFPGEKTGGNKSGDLYDIIIFPEDPPKMPEKFQAILLSPLDYIENMIDNGFLGLISKVTTTSAEFVDTTFEALCKNASEYIDEYEKEGK
jgi:hypothetical protein